MSDLHMLSLSNRPSMYTCTHIYLITQLNTQSNELMIGAFKGNKCSHLLVYEAF